MGRRRMQTAVYGYEMERKKGASMQRLNSTPLRFRSIVAMGACVQGDWQMKGERQDGIGGMGNPVSFHKAP